MSDMPSEFWSGWIAVITIVSFVGLGWLIFSIYFSPAMHTKKLPDQYGTRIFAKAPTLRRCGGSG